MQVQKQNNYIYMQCSNAKFIQQQYCAHDAKYVTYVNNCIFALDI